MSLPADQIMSVVEESGWPERHPAERRESMFRGVYVRLVGATVVGLSLVAIVAVGA